MIAPLSGMPHRWSMVLSLLIAVLLLFFGRAEALVLNQVRASVTSFAAPVYEFFGPPAATIRNSVQGVFGVFSVMEENRRLKEENAQLIAWQDAALTLEQKVRRYEALLGLSLDGRIQFRSSRIVTDPASPFVQTMLINSGSRDGIAEGQAVIGPDGFIGRTIAVGEGASRVLMITDLNSRLPVLVEPSDERGILLGQNDDEPIITLLPEEHEVQVGQRVVTSGDGGLLPPGIIVGFVSQVRGREAKINPAATLSRLTYVRVLDYASPFSEVPKATKGPPVFDKPPLPIPTESIASQTNQAASETEGGVPTAQPPSSE